ncbi:hypothetical protein [Chitinophaga skermanii]|nr:hypothetical protein [Chitinophaga skermanii]
MKKFFKILKIALIVLLSIILIPTIYLYISNKLFVGGTKKDTVQYLASHSAVVKDSVDGKVFDEAFYQSQVILLGEIHGFAGNQTLDKNLLTYLHKKLGIKYYIAEMDSTTAKELNTFLRSSPKNLAILKDVVVNISKRIPQQSSQELLEKWDAIYDYNNGLADSMKITVLGIDKGFDDKDRTIPRDSAMFLNFQQYIQQLGLANEKFYGLFGYFHTLQQPVPALATPLATHLKKAGFKTISIVSHTIDSYMYLPKNPQIPTPPDEKIKWANADGPLMVVKGINNLKEASQPNSITLFNINAKNTPYHASQEIISMKSRLFGDNILPAAGTNTTQYFQYVALLRNSEALSKLK